MMPLLRKAGAFVVRDFRIESGYKTAFLIRIVDSMMLLVLFYFLSQLITPHNSSALRGHGYSYFSFALIGLAFARYFDLTLRMFSESIRLAQVTGCFEAMMSSQTGCITVALMSSLYGLISGGVQLLLILVAGVVGFGMDLTHLNFPATALVLVLSLTIFVAFGVLSAAAVVWLRKGDPITWILGGFGTIVGGAYFPTDMMPPWMQKIAMVNPITYCLDALRMTMLQGYSIVTIAKPLTTLLGIVAIFLPISLGLFSVAVRKGRREGTLTQY
jgi:ABC-2 type transport system permease protein